MNCKKAQKWMSLEFDDALGERRQELLNAHLAACAQCRAVRQQWLQLRTACRTRTPDQAIPAERMWQDVRRAIRDKSARSHEEPVSLREFLSHRRPVLAVAAIALVLAAGLTAYVWRTTPAGMRTDLAPMAVVEFVETELPGAAPMVYQDAETGWTVIWVVEANGKENRHAGT
jgi:predicted anti-sigma-YlaC factor YlaD